MLMVWISNVSQAYLKSPPEIQLHSSTPQKMVNHLLNGVLPSLPNLCSPTLCTWLLLFIMIPNAQAVRDSGFVTDSKLKFSIFEDCKQTFVYEITNFVFRKLYFYKNVETIGEDLNKPLIQVHKPASTLSMEVLPALLSPVIKMFLPWTICVDKSVMDSSAQQSQRCDN